LVNTFKRSSIRYLGCPINAVKIFSSFFADEITIINIDTRKNIDFKLLAKIASQSHVPISYGGMLRSFNDCKDVLSAGYEKVILRSLIYSNPSCVIDMINKFGAQAVCVSVDVYWDNARSCYIDTISGDELAVTLRMINWLQVGEVLLNRVEYDGLRCGPDKNLCSMTRQLVNMQLLYSGGVSSASDISSIESIGLDGCCVSSIFVEKTRHKGVILDYFR